MPRSTQIHAAGLTILVSAYGVDVKDANRLNGARTLDLRALRGAVALYAADGTCAAVTPRACEMLAAAAAVPVSADDVRAVLVATAGVDVGALEAAATTEAARFAESLCYP